MKYVMFSTQQIGGLRKAVPVIFPNELVHADIVNALQSLAGLENATVVSAGEISIHGACNGGSLTLDVKSRGEVDENIINSMDYFHGIEGAEEALPKELLSVLRTKL